MRSELVLIRVRLLFFLLLIFAIILVSRLYFVQIVSGEIYSTKADRQYLKPNSSILNRGTIYFKTKDGEIVTAAHQKTGDTIAINPSILKDPEMAFEQISKVVSIDKENFLLRAAKKNDPYEEVLKKVDLGDGEKIRDLNIPGVNAYKEKWRFYPNHSAGAHVLGIMAHKGDEYAGRYGLEQYYEDILVRKNELSYSNFFVEMFLNVKKTFSGEDSAEGDIVTSIEPTVESFLEREVETINKTWNGEFSGGIIINPKNGEIIAMAISPTFNPNDLKNVDDINVFSNKLVEGVYEMGSVVKPITLVSGLDSGAITARTTYFDSGSITLNNKTISNFDKKGRGLVDMQKVLNDSLNTGAAFVMSKMGKEKFSEYMLNFGFGEKTGVDLPNEAAPLADNLKSPREIEHATASFGQGVAISPISAARAFSVIANGGTLITPHIVTNIKYKSGMTKDISFPEGKRVLKKESAEEISRMLVEVVDDALLGGVLKLPHYSVAAKTGTAQIAKENSGGYYDDRYLHSFFGFFPAYDAKFLVFLITYKPGQVKYASETLARPFFNIVKYLINYYKIPPDR